MSDISVNRAPFLTLWATVVALRLGYDEDEALTLGRAVAGQTAAAKGKRLGLYEGRTPAEAEELRAKRQTFGGELVRFMGRSIPCCRTDAGLRALDEVRPVSPDAVRLYLESRFVDELTTVRDKLTSLAQCYKPVELERCAMDLYVRLRPDVPAGRTGWGKRAILDLDRIDRLIAERADSA